MVTNKIQDTIATAIFIFDHGPFYRSKFKIMYILNANITEMVIDKTSVAVAIEKEILSTELVYWHTYI